MQCTVAMLRSFEIRSGSAAAFAGRKRLLYRGARLFRRRAGDRGRPRTLPGPQIALDPAGRVRRGDAPRSPRCRARDAPPALVEAGERPGAPDSTART